MEEQFCPMSSMSYVLTRPAAAGEVERVINFLLAGFFLLVIWAWTPRITGVVVVVKERRCSWTAFSTVIAFLCRHDRGSCLYGT